MMKPQNVVLGFVEFSELSTLFPLECCHFITS